MGLKEKVWIDQKSLIIEVRIFEVRLKFVIKIGLPRSFHKIRFFFAPLSILHWLLFSYSSESKILKKKNKEKVHSILIIVIIWRHYAKRLAILIKYKLLIFTNGKVLLDKRNALHFNRKYFHFRHLVVLPFGIRSLVMCLYGIWLLLFFIYFSFFYYFVHSILLLFYIYCKDHWDFWNWLYKKYIYYYYSYNPA